MTKEEKNRKIAITKGETISRRKRMSCKTFKFKIQRDSLTSKQKESLKMFFIESKWVYNYLLSHQTNLYDINTKYKELDHITHLDKDGNEIEVNIEHIGSSVKQQLIRQISDEIRGLSVLKRKGYNVGTLKFKSEVNSIPLLQYKVTHYIDGHRMKIQGIKQPIRINGLKQLDKYENKEYTSAKLIYDGYDYYINLTCYIEENKENQSYKNDIIGVDLGIHTSITCSNGDKLDVKIKESDTLKKLQAKLARQTKRSNNWYKTKSLINKEYNHIVNQKNDAANKIVHKLLAENEIVVIQDDPLNEWHKEQYTTKGVQYSILGRVKEKLKTMPRVIILDQWFPTTKYCRECGITYNITLDERTFVCPNCNTIEDRDIHAANNMIYFYLQYKDTVGTTDTSKPVVIKFDKNLVAKPRKVQRL